MRFGFRPSFPHQYINKLMFPGDLIDFICIKLIEELKSLLITQNERSPQVNMDIEDGSDGQSPNTGPRSRRISMPIRSSGVDPALIDPEILGSDCEREEPELNEFDDAEEREYAPSDASSEYTARPGSDDENDIDSPPDYDLPAEQPPQSNPKKRSLSTTSPRPLKRRKPPPPFRPAYLDLLNEDIVSASTKFLPPPPSFPPLSDSQHGLAYWTETEKILLFESLSRLGPSNPLAISQRLKTKSELEVSAYISLLKSSAGGSDPIPVSDIPSAVELSPALCLALEDASDAVATKQLTHERTLESNKWGPAHWLITPQNIEEIERDPDPKMLFHPLFRLRTWLKLSERVFMNSRVEDYNYRTFLPEKGQKPGIRATALEDFYSLVVSLTRRLVATSIFMAEERIDQKRKSAYPEISRRVWKGDVKAALLAVNMPSPARKEREKFWGEAARRLRLNVVDDSAQDGKVRMGWDQVEEVLGVRTTGGGGPGTAASAPEGGDDDEGSGYEEAEQYENESEYSFVIDGLAEKLPVLEEVEEAVRFSALEYPDSKQARKTLRDRIRNEKEREGYADKLDMSASRVEEKRLWELLGQKPPEGMAPLEEPVRPAASKGKIKTVAELIGGFDRGLKTEGEVPSNWEMEYVLLKQAEREKEKAGRERLRELNKHGDDDE
ncbi:hypothetical protein QC761_304560 [Podospora bellae-mahoneyi]|uniref:Myb-like domain-containing protein n=1 Tax=Podospora bellae-mahoneyi TaxID=2093777 RepID=A0ABR0FN12_9PEZI|nr:hypothetical protein QC761_304560 [Podospora bellae-mahoneyi]